jgi:DNA-binding transcriptional regulator WhiA
VMVKGSGLRKAARYVVRVNKDGESLARQTGLIDQRNRARSWTPARSGWRGGV